MAFETESEAAGQQGSILGELVGADTLPAFLADHFQTKHFLRRSAPAALTTELLSLHRFSDVLVRNQFAGETMRFVRESVSDTSTPPEAAVEPGEIWRRFEEGWSVVVNTVQVHDPAIAAVCRALSVETGHRTQANVYMTPPGRGGFGTHYDGHDVLVAQTAGSKTWFIYERPAKLPELPLHPHESGIYLDAATLETNLVNSFELHEGDVLYIPRGVPHRASTTDSASLHISYGLHAVMWGDVMKRCVENAMLDVAAMRSPVAWDVLRPEFRSAQRAPNVSSGLLELARQWDVERALNEAVRQVLATLEFPSWFIPEEVLQSRLVAGVDLVWNRDCWSLLEDQGENLLITLPSTAFCIEGEGVRMVAALREAGRIHSSAFLKEFSLADVVQVSQQLLLAGTLKLEDA